MNIHSALAVTAAFAVMSAGIPAAESHYWSINRTGEPQTSAASSNISSSSSLSSLSSSSSSSRNSSSMSRASSKTSSIKGIPFSSLPEKTQCMVKAIRKREAAIANSLNNYYALMSRMLEIRQGLIVKYWAELDGTKRDSEIRTTWRTFGSAWRTKGQLMREQRKEAWATYRKERSACGVYGQNDPEASGLTIDSQF